MAMLVMLERHDTRHLDGRNCLLSENTREFWWETLRHKSHPVRNPLIWVCEREVKRHGDSMAVKGNREVEDRAAASLVAVYLWPLYLSILVGMLGRPGEQKTPRQDHGDSMSPMPERDEVECGLHGGS